jgi:ADP-heptose:LPS heptosyltransferase
MALIEPRLVPLFQRSFPSIEIREAGLANAEAYAQADVVASYETLIEHIGVREDGGITALPALKPDPDQVAAFRSKYQSSNSLIGICWHSTNTSKDVPTVGEWADFLHKLNATFISTQYGDVKGDIETLRRLSGMQIIYDDSVDSLKNLDLFAAQVSVLDAMVTISNTGAHMAGALGIPTFVLLDDKDQLAWPFVGHSTGWYVSARLYRKAGRRWGDVFEDVSEDVTLAG